MNTLTKTETVTLLVETTTSSGYVRVYYMTARTKYPRKAMNLYPRGGTKTLANLPAEVSALLASPEVTALLERERRTAKERKLASRRKPKAAPSFFYF